VVDHIAERCDDNIGQNEPETTCSDYVVKVAEETKAFIDFLAEVVWVQLVK
jgi:hypothetical protein